MTLYAVYMQIYTVYILVAFLFIGITEIKNTNCLYKNEKSVKNEYNCVIGPRKTQKKLKKKEKKTSS